METEKVKEILRDLCKYRERDGTGVAHCLNRVYGFAEECECQCLQVYNYEEDNYD